MNVVTEFAPANRYVYDFNLAKDFAQVDTKQDASYFGIWCSPSRLKIITYCEGDVTVQTAENSDELLAELKRMDEVYGGITFDPGFNEELADDLRKLGLYS